MLRNRAAFCQCKGPLGRNIKIYKNRFHLELLLLRGHFTVPLRKMDRVHRIRRSRSEAGLSVFWDREEYYTSIFVSLTPSNQTILADLQRKTEAQKVWIGPDNEVSAPGSSGLTMDNEGWWCLWVWPCAQIIREMLQDHHDWRND